MTLSVECNKSNPLTSYFQQYIHVRFAPEVPTLYGNIKTIENNFNNYQFFLPHN